MDSNEKRVGYKKTKMGWIPVEWEAVVLSDVAEVQTGIAKGKKTSSEAITLPYLRVANVQDGHVILDEIKEITLDQVDIERYRLKAGDVLFTEGGDFDKLGRGCVWQGQIDPCLHQNHVFAVRCDPDRLLPSLLACNASAAHGRKYFILNSKQSTNLASINSTQLKVFPIPLPPLPEQDKIAEILSASDAAIEKTTDLIDAKQRQKKALMQQLLTGKRRLPGFEGKWVSVRIGDVMTEVSRPVNWDDDEVYRLVSVRRRSGGLFYREALQGRDILTKSMYTTHKGDFLISKMQVVHGAMAMTTANFDGGHISGSYISLVAKEGARLHMPFFDYLSRTPWLYHLAFISSYGVVIEKMTFNLKDFMKKRIKVPVTIEEQLAITNVLQSCEREIAVLQDKLTALKQQKKSLMQKLLTGQVRVKV